MSVNTIEKLLEDIAVLQLQKELIESQINEKKQFFKDRPEEYPAGTKLNEGKFLLKVTSNTRLDDGLALRELSAADYDKVSKKTLDTAKARKVLDEATLAKITKQYENKIEVVVL